MNGTGDFSLFDPGLQPERTALAWRRTALALTTAAIVAVRMLPELLGTWAILPAGAGLAGAVAVLFLAHRRHLTVHLILVRSDSDRVPLPGGALPLSTALLVSIGGVAALIAVIQGALFSER
jgi:putative membrane protein